MVDTYRLALLLAFQAPAICLVLCAYVFFSLPRNGINRRQFVLIRLMTIGCVGGVTSEVISGLMLYGVLDWSIDYYPINTSVAYMFVLMYAVAFSEFCISYIEKVPKILCRILRLIYALVGILLIARHAFINSKLFTYFSEEGQVMYGPLDDTALWGCLLLYAVLTYLLLNKYHDKKEYVNREKNQRLLFVSGTMTLALLLYSVLYLPYVIMLGSMLGVMVIFSSLQSLMIDHDELTSLNNRRRMLKDIESLINSRTAYSYILADINDFKSVNDNYGHNEGDRALAIVAESLNDVAEKNGSQAYRIGGDEFAIVVPSDDPVLTGGILSEAEEDLALRVEKAKLPYGLTLSFGRSTAGDTGTSDLQTVISEADADMYSDKLCRKGIAKHYG